MNKNIISQSNKVIITFLTSITVLYFLREYKMHPIVFFNTLNGQNYTFKYVFINVLPM